MSDILQINSSGRHIRSYQIPDSPPPERINGLQAFFLFQLSVDHSAEYPVSAQFLEQHVYHLPRSAENNTALWIFPVQYIQKNLKFIFIIRLKELLRDGILRRLRLFRKNHHHIMDMGTGELTDFRFQSR